MKRIPSLLLALLLLITVNPSPTMAQESSEEVAPTTKRPHHREQWMLGISLGAGPGHIVNKTSASTMDEWGGVLQLRGGGMIHRKLLFHLDLEGWFRDTLWGSTTYQVDMFQYSLALTWFPFDPTGRSGGWWFRAGVGLANVRVQPDGSLADQAYTEGGWNGLLAAGYEFRVSRSLALGLGLSFNNLGVSGDVFEDARWAALTADLNWYPQ